MLDRLSSFTMIMNAGDTEVKIVLSSSGYVIRRSSFHLALVQCYSLQDRRLRFALSSIASFSVWWTLWRLAMALHVCWRMLELLTFGFLQKRPAREADNGVDTTARHIRVAVCANRHRIRMFPCTAQSGKAVQLLISDDQGDMTPDILWCCRCDEQPAARSIAPASQVARQTVGELEFPNLMPTSTSDMSETVKDSIIMR